jgi:hypothetical protein
LDKALDGKLGYGAGIHVFVGFDGGSALVPRIDGMIYKNTLPNQSDIKLTEFCIGADYNDYEQERHLLACGLGVGHLQKQRARDPLQEAPI